jgi:hypothetical protein
MHKAMPSTPHHAAAINFLQSYIGKHDQPDDHNLMTRTICHLVSKGPSYTAAKTIALQAFAELMARGKRAYIDCDRTTSYALFLMDNNGNETVYTLPELLDIIAKSKRTDL